MQTKRIMQSLVLATRMSARKRADYLRKNNIFQSIGPGCLFQLRKVPLHPQLIRLGHNVTVGAGVVFMTHDAIHHVLNEAYPGEHFQEMKGCIEVGDHVFIGAHSLIRYDVKIGSRVVIAAGSVIVHDVPDDTVVGGGKIYRTLGTFDELAQKRRALSDGKPPNESPEDETLRLWKAFYEKRGLPAPDLTEQLRRSPDVEG